MFIAENYWIFINSHFFIAPFSKVIEGSNFIILFTKERLRMFRILFSVSWVFLGVFYFYFFGCGRMCEIWVFVYIKSASGIQERAWGSWMECWAVTHLQFCHCLWWNYQGNSIIMRMVMINVLHKWTRKYKTRIDKLWFSYSNFTRGLPKPSCISKHVKWI